MYQLEEELVAVREEKQALDEAVSQIFMVKCLSFYRVAVIKLLLFFKMISDLSYTKRRVLTVPSYLIFSHQPSFLPMRLPTIHCDR